MYENSKMVQINHVTNTLGVEISKDAKVQDTKSENAKSQQLIKMYMKI